jgi:hypothetical protein
MFDHDALTDEDCLHLYLTGGWEAPGNHEFPDPAIAFDVRDILRAETPEEGAEAIRYWLNVADGETLEIVMPRVRQIRSLVGLDGAPPPLVQEARAAHRQHLRMKDTLQRMEEDGLFDRLQGSGADLEEVEAGLRSLKPAVETALQAVKASRQK